MQPSDSLPPAYFDQVYAANADPWHFETSNYEHAKYAATLAALPRQHFDCGLEIGCSIGVLTALLAPRCHQLLAVDVSAAALQTARQRLAAAPQVLLRQMALPHHFPRGDFDLVVLSEVGYFWCEADLALAAQRMVAALRPAGVLLLAHWTPLVSDFPLTGDAVHRHFLQYAGPGGVLRHLVAQREATYRLDVLERAVQQS